MRSISRLRLLSSAFFHLKALPSSLLVIHSLFTFTYTLLCICSSLSLITLAFRHSIHSQSLFIRFFSIFTTTALEKANNHALLLDILAADCSSFDWKVSRSTYSYCSPRRSKGPCNYQARYAQYNTAYQSTSASTSAPPHSTGEQPTRQFSQCLCYR